MSLPNSKRGVMSSGQTAGVKHDPNLALYLLRKHI